METNAFQAKHRVRSHGYFVCLLALMIVAVNGCGLLPGEAGPTAPEQATQSDGAPNPDAQSEATVIPANETPVVSISDVGIPTRSAPALPTPEHPAEPLRFTFPTTGPEPVSRWRPPLYPIPWEPTANDHFYFLRPIGANEINWPLARYRYGGVFFEDTVHTGVDIPAPKGTPVLASGPGKVVWAGYGLFFLREEIDDPYGLAISIEHDFGYQGEKVYTIYGHLDEIYAFRGQEVETGQLIGLVGETGNVTGPHLHFEVRLEDNKAYGSRNPELWISPPQGWGVLAGRVMGHLGGLLYKQRVNLRNTATNQHWYVITYGLGGVNSDSYYNENMVIGDLPAGEYYVWVDYDGITFGQQMTIDPGMVTFFTFKGRFGFNVGPPPTPIPDFISPDGETATPEPTP